MWGNRCPAGWAAERGRIGRPWADLEPKHRKRYLCIGLNAAYGWSFDRQLMSLEAAAKTTASRDRPEAITICSTGMFND